MLGTAGVRARSGVALLPRGVERTPTALWRPLAWPAGAAAERRRARLGIGLTSRFPAGRTMKARRAWQPVPPTLLASRSK